MGMAASQSRLLMLTARIHDVEYQAQMIQNAKIQLATQEDEVYRKYTEALDATTLTYKDMQGNRIPASYNNLAGVGSIGNNIAGDKQYVFRDGSDNLIIPQSVYNSYNEYFNGGTGDPYEFAMHMMGVNTKDPDYQNKVNDVINGLEESDYLHTLKEKIDDDIQTIAGKSSLIGSTQEEQGDMENASISELREKIFANDLNGIKEFYNESEFNSVSDKVKAVQEKQEEYQQKLYKKSARQIYEKTGTGEAEDFDQDKFNYYLLYAKLIQKEGGLEYTSTMDQYGSDAFENDSQFLQDMLKAGKIRVETAWINDRGKAEDSTTSVPSDSNLEYTTTSTIDKKALAIAEAEYEHEMKKIDRKDKQYDMDLNKLETERTALTTEYDSVKKVIQDNIERTFGIFS